MPSPLPTVLIVDDEPDIRTIVRLSLVDEGFQVIEASDGAQALDMLATSEPEVMVLDIMMPGMSGFDVLAARRERDLAAGTRVTLMTCRTAEGDDVRGWELGADEYLTKPFEAESLAARLRELLQAAPSALECRRAAELEKAAAQVRFDRRVRSVPGAHGRRRSDGA